jgi:hypothetical protein
MGSNKHVPIEKGTKFGRLTVIKFVTRAPGGYYKYSCKCSCGNILDVRADSLRSGNTTSCSCYFKMRASESAKLHMTKHGYTKYKMYKVWESMHSRCYNPNNERYKDYGARGIRVCAAWHDFANFHKDIGDNKEGLTLDRIDNNADYSPSNCRLATYREQNRNKRNSKFLTYNGLTLCVAEWADRIGMSKYTLYGRIDAGWSTARILTTPPRRWPVIGVIEV